MSQESQQEQEPSLEEIIEIRDPAVDVEAVMRQIRANMHQRRLKAEAEGVDLEGFGAGLNVDVADSLSQETRDNLQRLGASYNKTNVGLFLTASRMPLLGFAWQKVRQSLHHLVLFYANRVANKQAVFNRYVVHTLTALIQDLTAGNGRLADQIEALQARVEALEAALEQQARE